VPAAEAAIWGNEQLEWLLDGLRRSPAPVKIIANGTQIISKDGRGEGHLNEAPEEFRRLLDFLKANRIGGVIVLSGDRHFTEVMRLSQEGGPDILEFTSSPIQQGQAVAPLEREHETHVWAMRGNSYGLVTITVESNGEGLVRFEMRDANNQVPLRAPDQPAMSEFSLKSLMYPE
jgi:alkaline phosphatase D